jgi:hypothetical protein
VNFLQLHEKAPANIVEEFDEKESNEFLDIWKEEFGKNKNLVFADIIQDWNMWYKEFDPTLKLVLLKEKESIAMSYIEDKKFSKKAFYRYPDSTEAEKIFDFDDLGENTLVIGCCMDSREDKYNCYVYQTSNFSIEEDVNKHLKRKD